MSPRTTEQNKKIRVDRKAAILDAALHVFAEEGYHSASISKVSKMHNIDTHYHKRSISKWHVGVQTKNVCGKPETPLTSSSSSRHRRTYNTDLL